MNSNSKHKKRTSPDPAALPESSPRSQRLSAVGWTFVYIAVFAITQVIAGLAIVALFAFSAVNTAVSEGSLAADDSYALAEFVQELVVNQIPASMPWVLLISSLLTIVIAWFIAKKRGFDVSRLAGLNPASASTVASALFLGIGFSLAFNSVLNMPGLEGMHDSDTTIAQSLLFGSILTAIVGSTIVPIVEEIVFRGFILNELRRGFSLIPAVAFSSLVFGALHGTAAWAVMALILGLLLAWVALRTRSVYAAIATHIGINATSFTMAWSNPDQTSTFIAFIVIGAVLLVASTVLILRNSKPLSQLEPAPQPAPKKRWHDYADTEAEAAQFLEQYQKPPKRWFQG